MRLLPKEFTNGLKKVTGQFLRGVWNGMGPSPKPRLVRKVKRVKWSERKRSQH